MTHSFLLRFQELCDEPCPSRVACETETITKVMMEQSDADKTMSTFKSLPSLDVYAGTATLTRMNTELGDADYNHAARTLPITPVAGTTTKTAVKMEADDQDPRQLEMSVFPKCS